MINNKQIITNIFSLPFSMIILALADAINIYKEWMTRLIFTLIQILVKDQDSVKTVEFLLFYLHTVSAQAGFLIYY